MAVHTWPSGQLVALQRERLAAARRLTALSREMEVAPERRADRASSRSTDCLACARYALRIMTRPAADDEAAARKRRAASRGQMTGRVLALGEEEPAEPPPRTSAERISLLVELTEAAWAMTGQPWPSLPRARWPGRVRLLGEAP